MTSSVSVPPRLEVALPPMPRLRLFGLPVRAVPGLWAWPLVLTLLFVLGVGFWLSTQQTADEEIQRRALISDALSLEAQLNGRLDGETTRLRVLADAIAAQHLTPDTFSRHPLVLDGLRRFWVSVTWLDAGGRIVATVPEREGDSASTVLDTGGKVKSNDSDEKSLAGHLHVLLPKLHGQYNGALVVRYSAADLLKSKTPWWLAAKYDVRLVDELDEVFASTVSGPRAPWQEWYRVSMGNTLPQAWLELSARDRIRPWWQTLPMALMGGFVLLVVGASVMLRRQMRAVWRAEEAWRTEAAWRTAMEDSLAVGIRARDLDGRLVYVNKTMADMVGFQPEELVGKLPPMPYWRPDDPDSMTRHLRNMAGKAPRMGYESKWQHRNGDELDVMIFEAPLVDAKGRQIGWMASVVNVTERKKMEERERRQVEAMAHHARLTMLGEVASTLAHELNQPLTVIASYNTGVLNALSRQPQTDPALIKALQRLGEQAAHAGRIVKRIRAFLTRREPQLERCDLSAVIESGVSLLRRDLARQGVDVQILPNAALPAVVADPVLLEQVVVNLVRNAGDALLTEEGARYIKVSSEATAPDEEGMRWVKVRVRDNGPGLGDQTIDTLCAPFYSTKADGMGMGLAICRSIMELHYGSLAVEPVSGPGACLSFTLPLRPVEDVADKVDVGEIEQ